MRVQVFSERERVTRRRRSALRNWVLACLTALLTVVTFGVTGAPRAGAEPNADPEAKPSPNPFQNGAPLPDGVLPPAAGPPLDGAGVPLPPPVDDSAIVSAPPSTSTSPDGWSLTVGAKDETIKVIAPLTTALSSRNYEVGGVFTGSMSGPDDGEAPRGVLEVGYQIGCGIDMGSSSGVTISGSMGITPSLGLLGVDGVGAVVDGIAPVLSTPMSGGIAIALKPGSVNVVPVSKKEYQGSDPWISVSGFFVKIDGCVGESFIRSYAVLTRSTSQSDALRAYYGTVKKV